MLGYVRAYKPELKFREYDLYRGVYCSICKRLLKCYSPPAQLFLSYDVTLLAFVIMAIKGETASLKKTCCCYNPAKRCHSCLGVDDIIDFCADISVILAYHRLRDNIRDKGFFGKLVSFLFLPFVSLMRRKASRRQPAADEIVSRAMLRQSEVEKRGDASLDAAADPSASAMSELLCLVAGDGADIEKLRRFGYLLGRYVYITDAADDIKSDIKSGAFNPLKSRYTELHGKDEEEFRSVVLSMLNLNIGELVRCYESIDFKCYGDIIYNILFYGLYNSALSVLKKYQKGGAQNEESL